MVWGKRALTNLVDGDVVGRAGAKGGLGQGATIRAAWSGPALGEAGIPEDRPAFVLRLVGAVAGAGDGTNQTADQGTLARARAAVRNGPAGGAQACAEQPPESTGLGDTPGAITAGGAIGCRGGHRNRSRRVHRGGACHRRCPRRHHGGGAAYGRGG